MDVEQEEVGLAANTRRTAGMKVRKINVFVNTSHYVFACAYIVLERLFRSPYMKLADVRKRFHWMGLHLHCKKAN